MVFSLLVECQVFTILIVHLGAGQIEASTSPPGIIRAFDRPLYPGRVEIEGCLGRVGNLNRIYPLFWRNISVSSFRFLQGLTDLQ